MFCVASKSSLLVNLLDERELIVSNFYTLIGVILCLWRNYCRTETDGLFWPLEWGNPAALWRSESPKLIKVIRFVQWGIICILIRGLYSGMTTPSSVRQEQSLGLSGFHLGDRPRETCEAKPLSLKQKKEESWKGGASAFRWSCRM